MLFFFYQSVCGLFCRIISTVVQVLLVQTNGRGSQFNSKYHGVFEQDWVPPPPKMAVLPVQAQQTDINFNPSRPTQRDGSFYFYNLRAILPISFLYCIPAKEILSIALYAFLSASFKVSPTALTPRTRPPLVTSLLFSIFVPA